MGPGALLGAGELLLHLTELLLFGLLLGVPAVAGHLLINAALHAYSVVKSGVESLVHIGGGGLYGAVHIQVADALGGEEYTFHYLSVVHVQSSLNQIIEVVEQLLVAVYQLLGLLPESRVGELVCGGPALAYKKLGVAESIFNIEQFFRTHFLYPFSFFRKALRFYYLRQGI